MRQKEAIFHLVDLPDHIASEIEQNLPDNCRIEDSGSLDQTQMEKNSPMNTEIVFITPERWKIFSMDHDPALEREIQKVLIIDDNEKLSESDLNEMGSFLGILHRPITEKSLSRLRDKAIEIQELYTDLHLMAREITLERELLARKNLQLEFLNRILSRASSSLKVEDILEVARQEFSSLMDAKGLAAVFWKRKDNSSLGAEIYLPGIKNKKIKSKWIENLLGVCKRFSESSAADYKEVELGCKSNRIVWLPNPIKQIVIPLHTSKKSFGAIVIAADQSLRLGRDQLQIINSAGNHLALTLRNAMKYKDLKHEADFDGLTNVYNRQQFDKRLRVELKRHQRHVQPLSLIMLDLDHFKKLNDSYGHVAGDKVLKRVGYLLESTVRETDFAARYGGEEFVVILPETSEEQAWLLAERIRKKISSTVFSHEDNKFNVTASIGVASMKPGPLTPGDTLVLQADQALYLAKNSGRNMVCTSADVCLGEAAIN